MIKLKPHSIVDVICNSSTTTYVWQDSSVEPCRELVQEFCNVMGYDKDVDDMFSFVVLCDSFWCYEDHEDYPYDDEFDSLIEDIKMGVVNKPDWMIEVEQQEDDYTYHTPDTSLYITPKHIKYENLAKALKTFLNSPAVEGGYDG